MAIHIEKHCRMAPAPKDGTRILVMRRWPRGVRKDRFHAWERVLGPSNSLLDSFLNLQKELTQGEVCGLDYPFTASRRCRRNCGVARLDSL